MTKPGLIALRKRPDNNISDAEYVKKVARKYVGTGIEELTIGSFDIYTEYTPITYVENRNDFERDIEEMYLKGHRALKTENNNDFDELICRAAKKMMQP